MFDDFWKGIKDRLNLCNVQSESYEPDPKLCLPPHTIYAATESSYSECVGETAANEPVSEAKHDGYESGTQPADDEVFDALADLGDSTPLQAAPYWEETNSGPHYQFVEQDDTSGITRTSTDELEGQYIEPTYYQPHRHVRLVDYEHEIEEVHKRLEKEDGVYRPNRGLRLNIEKSSKAKKKAKRGGRRVRGNGIRGGSSMDIVERSLAVMDAQKRKAEMAEMASQI
ncbi:hypothetical protein G7Y79_00016g040990 [Physcia stellaris]|nr:hypothetical protein G7Y79_00016g040990 [Physcia stellaris]